MRHLVAILLLTTACVGTTARYPRTTPIGPPAPPGEDFPGSGPELAGATSAPGGSLDEDIAYVRSRSLLIPVPGVLPSQLEDTYQSPRDGGGRTHHAIDILVPRGTPIISADDGRIFRLSNSALGGISLYAVDPTGRIVYYYAHMERYRPGVSAGMAVARGDTIGFVGSTGNATTPHLHFQIMRMAADGRYWAGDPINPYPILRGEAR